MKLPLKITMMIASALTVTALGAQAAMADLADLVLVAHRGLSDAAQNKYGIPEHSAKAYNWALGQGAEVLDFDVQYTRDEKLVIMHNTTLDENTNGTGRVRDKTLEDIKKLWLELPRDLDGNGNDDNTDQHPLSLSQGLNLVQPRTFDGRPVMITLETKGSWSLDRMKRLYTVINGRGMRNRVILHSFELDHVKWAKTAGFPLRGYVVASDATSLPSPATVKTYATYVFVPLAKLTAAKADEYRAAGIKVAVWTLDNTDEYDQAVQKSADIWICNDIAEAQDYLEQVA